MFRSLHIVQQMISAFNVKDRQKKKKRSGM